MTTYYVNSNNCAPWTVGTAYSIGDRCVSTIGNTNDPRRFNVYECTTGGTSHATTEPTWNTTVGGTVGDNDVIWTTRRPDSWANAHHSFSMMCSLNSIETSGDVILVDKTHAENVGSDYSGSLYGGAYNNPIILCCVDKTNSDAIDTGASITFGKAKVVRAFLAFINIKLSTAYDLDTVNLSGGFGLYFIGTVPGLTLLELTGASNRIEAPASVLYATRYLFQNCNISLANAANYIGANTIHWRKGSLIAPNGVTVLFLSASVNILLDDVDLSAVGAGSLIEVEDYMVNGQINRCKLSATGSVLSAAFGNYGYQGKVKLHHCSSANRTWDFGEYSAEGVVTPDADVYRTGGASDGTTAISWKFVSTAALSKSQIPLSSPSINLWNAEVAEKTLTIHGILDSATNLKKDEVWMEVDYPADASSGLGALATSQVIYQPATGSPADLDASTETWEEAMANPNKFKFAVTFTPGKAGPIAARICVNKPSTTLYICPKAVIS